MENSLSFKYYKLTFEYAFIENVDYYLSGVQILRKTFDNNFVSYTISYPIDKINNLVKYLKMMTSNQIKVEDLTISIEDLPEVGTDKPLGSKAAIDEN